MAMIRTANLTHSISRNAGGLFESVRRLVQSLGDTGMDVRVLGVQDEFTAEDVTAWAPVWAMGFKPAWPTSFGYSPKFFSSLVEFAPQVTHTHGLWVYPSVATNHYCRRSKTPYLISPHGMLDPWAIRNSRWKKVIAYFLYEGAHLNGARCVRALCESEARSIRQVGLKNHIAIIPNGIDLPTAPPRQDPPWHGLLEPGRKTLLFLSRIHPKKGLPNLLQAWAQSRKAAPHRAEDWTLIVAGWNQGGHEQELQRLATDLELPWADTRTGNAGGRDSRGASVLFVGPQFGPAKVACYHGCDGFILPSFSEGLPMVVLEAWAHGKPVVMTPECNLPEGFACGGAVSIEANPDRIARGLDLFWSMTDAERISMGRRGYELTRARFAWPHLAEEMKEVYEWMLGGGSPPSCVVGV